ncbi:MAG: glycogen-binding domain-containing protein [Elusimicrobiota bacterium]
MNQKNLVSLIILDVIVIAFAIGLIALRYKSLTSYELQPLFQTTGSTVKDAVPQAGKPANTSVAKKQGEVKLRNIGFTFRNSKVKKVAIIGSFNNWIPQALVKGENHTWKINLSLPPGEYAYNFVADGRPLKDPNNTKVCNAGRGFTNSYLKIEPK